MKEWTRKADNIILENFSVSIPIDMDARLSLFEFKSHVAVCMAKPTRHLHVCNFNKHTNELSSSCITFVNSRKCIIHLHTYGRYVRVCPGILDFGIRLARKNHFLIILHATTRTPIARVAKPDAAREQEKLPPKNENEYRKRTRQ